MADSGAHFYLQSHTSVEFDPLIATLPATYNVFFHRLRMMALRCDTPGVFMQSWATLCKCLGIKSPARQERLLQEMEDRGLVGIRERDKAVMIARWTMPQLDAARVPSEPFPSRRPRYPSDDPQYRAQKAAEKAAQEPTATPESTSDAANRVARFFDNVEPLAESASTPQNSASTPHRTENPDIKRREEHNTESSSSPSSPNPHIVEEEEGGSGRSLSSDADCEQAELLDALLEAGVAPGNAARLINQVSPEIIREQLRFLPLRNVDNPPGALYEACLHPEQWPPPKVTSAGLRATSTPGSLDALMAEEDAAMRRLNGRNGRT